MTLKTVEVVRDDYGCWAHPQVSELFDRDPNREYVPKDEWNAWLNDHNIQVLRIEMEHDLDERHPVWVKYFDQGEPGCSDWHPEPPSPSWRLLSIQETEDGPIAMFYRDKAVEEGPINA